MKKITLLILFCFCAVGFSQAQIGPENSGEATSTDTKSLSGSIDLLSLGLERNAVLKPKKTVQQGEMKDLLSLGLERKAVFNTNQASSFTALENEVSTHLINHNATSVELLDGATAVAGQVTITSGHYNGRSFNNPSNTRSMPVLAYESGPYFNVAGSPDRSVLESTTLGMGTLGGGVQISAGNRMTDDIILSDDYDVTSIDVFGYQTGAPSVPASINEINVQIWDGDPSDPASNVVWGDDVTNVLTSVIWSDAYRDTETTVGATNRAIQRVTVETPGLSLAAGTYWVDYSMGGDAGFSGPWQPPVVILGETMTGNAQQSIAGVWGPFQDGGTTTQLGVPVQVNGDCTSCVGALAFPITFEGQVVPFSDFNGSATQVIANPDATGVNTSANVAENVVPATAAFAGVNIVIPVDLTDDKFFSMNVWSPLTDTPILLKLEGGPNPPVEREVIMTTTGAWEEIVFDFSSEGAITFDSVTLFMNFNMIDPANQTFYWDNLGQMNSTGGGGGGMACNEENLSNSFENGFFTGTGSTAPQQVIATDITIPADTDLSLTSINAPLAIRGFGESITSVDVVIYGDAGGLPDTANIIASFPALVPVSQTIIGTAFTDFEFLDVTFDLPATMLAGQLGAATTYWLSIYGTASNADDVLWEATGATVIGNEGAFSVDNGATWAGNTSPFDMVYNFSGECTAIVGPSDNDTCEDATPVACGDTVLGDTLTNTDTGGNPAADEWYSFTGTGAPELVTISLCDGGTDYDSLLRVFSDCTLANEIATNDDFCGTQSELSFSSDGTSTYYIMVEGFGSEVGNFSLAVSCTSGPVNDDCSGALPIACGEIVSGTTIDATEDSAAAPTCDTSVTAPGVWYVYEDTTGLITDITITMCNGTTDYDSKLSVYTGDCGAPPFDCVVGNDDTCGLQSEVSFQSDGATTFYILVHGFGSNEGNFEIEMTCALVPPPNDMIANSIDVDEIGFPYTDPSVAMPAATFEAGSPVDCDNAGARGVWYNFVPTGDGTATATITTPGVGGLLFTVNNGPLAGAYPAIAADFGGAFTTTAITEDTSVVIDDDVSGDANDACDPILNGASLVGKIAIVRRGACAFTDKVIAAQNEGAIAVIVVNNIPGDPIVMGGANPDVTIPALMLSDVDGEAIIAEVLGGGSLNATMVLEPAGFSAVTFYTAPSENSVETDLVLVNWFENQCLPGTTASIPTVAGQAYYVFVANHDAVTDIVIDGTNLGTEDNTIEGFSYYPNPAGSTLNLSAQDTIESVVIYNMLGQKVFDQNVGAIRSELNVSDLATGTYILQVSVNGQIGTYQILKK